MTNANSMKKLAVFILFLLAIATVQAQQTDPEKLQTAVDSQTFIFEARQTSGVRGRTIQLTPGYLLDVSPGLVRGDLPFFGRSYQATPGSTEGGLKFELDSYEYVIKPKKKSGWDITIKPTDSHDIRAVYLTIQASGNASLRVASNSKETVSYIGIIK